MNCLIFRQFCLLVALWGLPLWVQASTADDQYQQAMQLTKQGFYSKAIPLFEKLISQHPEHLNYRYDYIMTLGWQGKDKELLAVSRKLDPRQTPPHVLEMIGKSARNKQQYDLAQSMYRLALRKDPNRLQSKLGLAYALLETGQTDEPLDMLVSLVEHNPRHVDTLEALATAHYRNKDYFRALSFYQKILKIRPDHNGAQRGLIRVATRLGAPHIAMEWAENNPGLINDDELSRIKQDRAAIRIRWGQLYQPDDQQRYVDTDKALNELQALLDYFAAKGEINSIRVHQIKTDILVGQLDRKRTKEVVELFETLKAQDAYVADYGLLAAAAAYQAEGQSKQASNIYRQIIQTDPDHFEARVGLIYATLDIPDPDEALKLANELARSEEEWIGGKDSPNRKENPDKITAEVTRALALAWTNHLPEAHDRFETMVREAPFNSGLRADRAYTYLWRGWPKRALQEFRLARDIDKESLTAAVGEVDALLEDRHYKETESVLLVLKSDYPDEERVTKQQRRWDVHNMRELYLEVSGNNSTADQFSSRGLRLDAWQYTAPWNHNYRFFAHENMQTETFEEGSETYWRFGGGIEYRNPNWQLAGELSTGPGDYSNLGLSFKTTWTPDDYWTTTLSVNSYSNDVPLRGRLNEDIDGSDISADVTYRFHESLAISFGAQVIDMSDDNKRVSMNAALFQRLNTAPVYKLDGILEFYTSSNTRENAPYFNPESDSSASITLINEWLVSRNKKRDFLQRLGIGLGFYDQEGFNSGSLWSISYQHEWVVGDELVLQYGISHSRHPYDGVQEGNNQFNLMLDWRF